MLGLLNEVKFAYGQDVYEVVAGMLSGAPETRLGFDGLREKMKGFVKVEEV